jgi:hypothetical protein
MKYRPAPVPLGLQDALHERGSSTAPRPERGDAGDVRDAAEWGRVHDGALRRRDEGGHGDRTEAQSNRIF